MWNPDQAPRLGFENLARKYGLNKARAMWAAYQRKLAHDEHQAEQQEKAWAAERHRKGPLVVRNDFDFYPTFHISPLTYKKLHRATLPERGCKGGEALDDSSYMRDFLKRNPECAPQKITTGDIRSGWTAAIERAAIMGRMDRAMTQMRVNHILTEAAKQAPLPLQSPTTTH